MHKFPYLRNKSCLSLCTLEYEHTTTRSCSTWMPVSWPGGYHCVGRRLICRACSKTVCHNHAIQNDKSSKFKQQPSFSTNCLFAKTSGTQSFSEKKQVLAYLSCYRYILMVFLFDCQYILMQKFTFKINSSIKNIRAKVLNIFLYKKPNK